MRIAMVAYSGNSGIGYYSCQLCQELSKNKLSVTLLTNRTYHLDSVSNDFEVRKLFSRTRRIFFELPNFVKYVLSGNFDIIHFQSYIKFPEIDYPLWNYLKRRKKMVLTIHDILPHEPRFYDHGLFKKIYALFDALIVHSPGSREHVLKEFNIPEDRVTVIPHGLYDIYRTDSGLKRESARHKLSIHKDSKTILFFGHLARRKGLELLIEVFNEISQEMKNVQLLIAGSGLPDDNTYYSGLIDKAKRQGKIILNMSYIPFHEVQNYFMASDFVVLPYIEGSTSGVLKLAYAFDRPVITTDVGDLADMVRDGETGFIVRTSDKKMLKDRVLTLLGGNNALETFSQNIRKFKQQFRWDIIAHETMGLYERLYDIKHAERIISA